MTKLLTVPCLLLSIAGGAQAAENAALRANVGVGLGTLLFEAVGSDALVSQALAATTNGSFGNQTFAISSGTLGASKPKDFVMNQQVHDYVNDNLDILARDMSAGHGEALDTLAELAGVPAAERPAFYAKMQANYASIFTSADVTSDQVIANIDKFAA